MKKSKAKKQRKETNRLFEDSIIYQEGRSNINKARFDKVVVKHTAGI